MNHIILSIQPQWLAKILNGEKTVEIRKSVPGLPCTVWIYCTKGKDKLYYFPLFNNYGIKQHEGKTREDAITGFDVLNGKIVAKFLLEESMKFSWADAGFLVEGNWYDPERLLKKSAMRPNAMSLYAFNRPVYAWFISNLEILDEPLALGDFYHLVKADYGLGAPLETYCYDWKTVERAPQSWFYCKPIFQF